MLAPEYGRYAQHNNTYRKKNSVTVTAGLKQGDPLPSTLELSPGQDIRAIKDEITLHLTYKYA